MYLKLVCLSLYFLTNVQSDNIDCVEGEVWFEPCRFCTCLQNGTHACQPHFPSCLLGKCVKNVIIFQKNFRCHCAKNNATICVPLLYQEEIDGKTCSGDYYYYDSCTFCKCDNEKKIFECNPIDNCHINNGGICNDEEIIFEESCYKCSCTFTKFKKCILSTDCFFRKEKPGYCYMIQHLFKDSLRFYCMSVIKQECYNDYGCPGQKKCCHVVDCYLRCVDPYFE